MKGGVDEGRQALEQVQPSKTLWDVPQLLIVPAILVGIGLAWNSHRADERPDAHQEPVALQPFSAVRSVAHTATLTTLSRVDGERRSVVVRFLEEARLILRRPTRPKPGHLIGVPLGRKPARVELVGANLENVVLPYADLTGADFSNADLTGAKLDGAKLDRAKVEGARGFPNQSH